jgi:sugar phosphate isomerase/epimerase
MSAMKILTILFLLSFLGAQNGFSKGKKLDNSFYCFNNALRLPNAPTGYEAQAALVKKLAYSGIAGHGEEKYFELRQALDKVGVAMPEIYIPFTIDQGVPVYQPLLKELIKDSKNRDLLVTLHLHSESYKNNKDAGDLRFAGLLAELADYAAQFGVKLAIYPHVNFYCEDIDHVLKLVKLTNRPNLGAVFNLCHFLKVEGEERLEEQVRKALPYLFMVSLSGADAGDTKKMDWNRLIQPLGNGSFDTYPLVKLLKDNDYNGKFGLQCYNIRMDCETALTQSMDTWKEYKKRYSREKH